MRQPNCAGRQSRVASIPLRHRLCRVLPRVWINHLPVFHQALLPRCAATRRAVGPLVLGDSACPGVLMTLAVVPVICTLRMTRLHAAIAVGLLLWVAGGAAPLLQPNPLMSTTAKILPRR